jgi:hypothetical protein
MGDAMRKQLAAAAVDVNTSRSNTAVATAANIIRAGGPG